MSHQTPAITPLTQEARSALPTHEAARHLNLKPQTLRKWAMTQRGPIRPQRVGSRLAWPVADLIRVLGVK